VNAGECVGKEEPLYAAGGDENQCNYCENCVEAPQKLKVELNIYESGKQFLDQGI
jgi:predicted molibdopterin-dependent oxidoreductase YjgC